MTWTGGESGDQPSYASEVFSRSQMTSVHVQTAGQLSYSTSRTGRDSDEMLDCSIDRRRHRRICCPRMRGAVATLRAICDSVHPQ